MKNILAFTLLTMAWGSYSGHAQEVEGEKKENAAAYLNLSVGVYYDEKLDDLPAEIETAGTFRKFTSVQWNAESRTLRFIPKAQGVGTLIIKHPTTGKILSE